MSQSGNITIKAKDRTLAGSYANAAQVTHTKEEFVVDFLSVYPPQGTLNARVILSPGHYKRLIRAMQENLQRYESQHGVVIESDGPRTQFGFPIE